MKRNVFYRFVQVTWPWLLYVGSIVLIAAVVAALTGCTTTKKMVVEKPVVVEKVHHDTLVQTRLKVDTFIMKDSVVVTELGTDRWHTRYLLRYRIDTVYKVRVDSIPKITTITKEIIKQVSTQRKWWETALMVMGGACLGGIIMWLRKKVFS
ncbi:MAG: hypothetical protein ACOCNZ_02965 [Prevotella sp.]